MVTTDDMKTIKAAMGQYEIEVAVAATRAATVLRHLLLPVLHSWGMGMKRAAMHSNITGETISRGGIVVYHLGSSTFHLEAQHDIVGGTWEVYKEYGDILLLQEHPILWKALNTTVMTDPDRHLRLLDYMEDIPLPPMGDNYVWITKAEDGTVGATVEPPPKDVIALYGPVTKAYLEAVSRHGEVSDYLYTLPRYGPYSGDFINEHMNMGY